MSKLNCNACGIKQASWQRSYKGKWYLRDAQGRPHFIHCPANPSNVQDAANEPTDDEVIASQHPEYQSEITIAQTPCATCRKPIGDDCVEQDQNGIIIKWCVACVIDQTRSGHVLADELGMSPQDHQMVERQIANAKPMLVAGLNTLLALPAYVKPAPPQQNATPNQVFRAGNPQPRPAIKPQQGQANPANIPCPKCRQPNRLTFQELTQNKTCC